MRSLATVLFLLVSLSSFACSCIDQLVDEKYSRADLVFVGLVTSAEIRPPSIFIKAQILESYKGDAEEEAQLVTALDTARCGFGGIVVNGRYLFYAGADGTFDICGGTREFLGSISARAHQEELERLKILGGT